MEFPDLGKHCSEKTCSRLDFLPVKCDACGKIFCQDHFKYSLHGCNAAYRKDVQVPVCPLCSQPVPVTRGEIPDIKVGEHIDNDCQSDPAKAKRKIYTNKCSVKGCKQREIVRVFCEHCLKNYCIKHRHPTDHQCDHHSQNNHAISKAGVAALNRFQSKESGSSHQNSRTVGKPSEQSLNPKIHSSNFQAPVYNPRGIQGSLSEDEALARAMQMSMVETSSNQPSSVPLPNQEAEDLLLAQAIAASEREHRQLQNTQQQRSRSTCSLS